MGKKVKLEPLITSISTLTTLYAEQKHNGANRFLITKLDELFLMICSKLFSRKAEVTAADLGNLESLKTIVLQLFLFKRLFNFKLFNSKYVDAHPEFKPDRVVEEMLHILQLALARQAEIFKGVQLEKPDEIMNDHQYMITLLV